MRKIKHKLENHKCIYADSQGQAGGLTMIWDKLAALALLSFLSNHIGVKNEKGLGQSPLHFIEIYDGSKRKQSSELRKAGRPT